MISGRQCTELMVYEATRDLPLCEVEVESPITVTKSSVLAGRKLAFVPILRAGLGMVDGALALVPAARVDNATENVKEVLRDIEGPSSYHPTPFEVYSPTQLLFLSVTEFFFSERSFHC